MVNDPVGDLIVQIKNASAVKKTIVSVPFSNFKLAIAEKLVAAGFIASAEKKGKKVKKTLDLVLKYNSEGQPIINGARRISKPGRRMYKSVLEIYPVRYGKGALILSTPAGVMTDKEAKKAKVGGEALFEIW